MAESRIPIVENQCVSLETAKAVEMTLVTQLLDELETRMESIQNPTLACLKKLLIKQMFCTDVSIKNAFDLRGLFKSLNNVHGCVWTVLVWFCDNFINIDGRYTPILQCYFKLLKKCMAGQQISIIYNRKFPTEIQNLESMHEVCPAYNDTFSKYQARNESFLCMSQTHGKNIDSMSASGFYATGDKDNIRCYYCIAFQRNWKPSDGPMANHDYDADCPYLKKEQSQKKIPSPTQISVKRIMDMGQLEAKTGLKQNMQPLVTKHFPKLKGISRNACQQKETKSVSMRRILSYRRMRKRRHNIRTFDNFNIPKEDLLDMTPKRMRHNQERSAATAIFPSHSSGLFGDGCLPFALKQTETPDNHNYDRDFESRKRLDQKDVLDSIEDTEEVVQMEEDGVGIKNVTNVFKCRTNGTSPGDGDERISNDSTFDILQEENKRLQEKLKCKMCYKVEISFVFLPCGHLVACVKCGESALECVDCNSMIEKRRKIRLV